MQVEERWFPPHRLCREALETASQPDPVLSQASQPSPLRPLAWGALPPAPVPVAPGRVSRCSVHRVCMVAPLIPSLLVLAPSSVTFAQRTRNLSRRDIRNLVVKKCLWKMEVQKPIMHHVTFLHDFFFLSCFPVKHLLSPFLSELVCKFPHRSESGSMRSVVCGASITKSLGSVRPSPAAAGRHSGRLLLLPDKTFSVFFSSLPRSSS